MSPKSNRPISSGPFVFNRWQRGSQLVLTRNPNYWGKKSYLNQIVYRGLGHEHAVPGDSVG